MYVFEICVYVFEVLARMRICVYFLDVLGTYAFAVTVDTYVLD